MKLTEKNCPSSKEDADAKGASVATAARYESAACDERNFSSSEERALAPLALASPRSPQRGMERQRSGGGGKSLTDIKLKNLNI